MSFDSCNTRDILLLTCILFVVYVSGFRLGLIKYIKVSDKIQQMCVYLRARLQPCVYGIYFLQSGVVNNA